MIIDLLKSWVKENEDIINNLFLYSLRCPMKITEMYKNIDVNGTGQSYRDLKKFLNSSYSDIDLTSIEIQIDTSESEGIIFFEYKFHESESYFYSLGKRQVKNFSKDEFFKYLNTGLEQALEKDNWIETFGNRYVTMLSKNELNLLYPDEKNIWDKKVKFNFKKEYQKFKSQPIEWNEGISVLLDLLLDDELKNLQSYNPLSEVTYKRFDNVKLKSFICEATNVETRITGKRSKDIPDVCVYIYAITNIPENDSLDTLTLQNINDWLTNNIKLININWIMDFLKSFPFNSIFYNYCLITTEVLGVNKKQFNNEIFHKFSFKSGLEIKNKKTIPTNKLKKIDFIDVLYNRKEDKLVFKSNSENFEDLPKEFVLKCNLLVCALLSELSEEKIKYDFDLIKHETYLLDLCEDFTQYKSLIKSVKGNFDIINEVPEIHLITMKDVYYYIHSHLKE